MEAGESKLVKVVNATNKAATVAANATLSVLNQVADTASDKFEDDLRTFDDEYDADLMAASILISKDMDFGNIKVEVLDCTKEFKLYVDAIKKVASKIDKMYGMDENLLVKMENLKDPYTTQDFGKKEVTVPIHQAYKIQKQDKLELNRFMNSKRSIDNSIEYAVKAYEQYKAQSNESIEPKRFKYCVNLINDFYIRACNYKRKQFESCIKAIVAEYRKYDKKKNDKED